MSRSAFVALVVGGLAFNVFAPARQRTWVIGLSVLGLVGFLALTNPDYWGRIESIQYRGEQVQGVDTGHGRMVLAQAQLQMSRQYPLGCGSRCTDTLSPLYLEENQLNEGTRSSHNTFLTMLVEQGIPGAVFYVLLVLWIAASLQRLSRANRDPGRESAAASLYPAVAGSLMAIVIGDLFAQFPKFELRFWFLTLAMVLLGRVVSHERSTAGQESVPTSPLAGSVREPAQTNPTVRL